MNKKLIRKRKKASQRARLTVKKFKRFFHLLWSRKFISIFFLKNSDERDLENISFDQEFAARVKDCDEKKSPNLDDIIVDDC